MSAAVNGRQQGALIFVRQCDAYGAITPLYRHRAFGLNRALVFADPADAQQYASRNGLIAVHDAERAK